MKQVARNLTNFEDGFTRDKKYLLMDHVGRNPPPDSTSVAPYVTFPSCSSS